MRKRVIAGAIVLLPTVGLVVLLGHRQLAETIALHRDTAEFRSLQPILCDDIESFAREHELIWDCYYDVGPKLPLSNSRPRPHLATVLYRNKAGHHAYYTFEYHSIGGVWRRLDVRQGVDVRVQSSGRPTT